MVGKEKEPLEEVVADNISKKMIMLGLEQYIEEELLITHDRIFFRAAYEIGSAISILVGVDTMRSGRVSGGPHDMIFSISPLDRDDHRRSYRENKRPSLQVVIGQASNGSYYGDAAIDLGNPCMDVVSFLVHMAELLIPGPTNHWKLKKRIDKEYEAWKRA